jgi:alkylation response protein AidB-like acyl-CoA dehydrogenase
MATNQQESATSATSQPLIPGGGFLIEERRPEEIFTPEDFSEQQLLLAQTAERFMRDEVLPHSEAIEHQEPGLTPRLLRKAGELGLLSIDIPERFGGMELDVASSNLANERIGLHASFCASFNAHTGIGALPLVYYGNEEQRKKYLPRLATGELIGAYALSEAEAGSDALAARTRATLSPDGKHYILNGEKMWITNAGFADLFNVFAKIDGEKFSCFLVEKGIPGFTMGAEEKKMGIKGSSTRALIFDNVPVPVENLLGEVGRGHVIAFNILNVGRLRLASACLGGSKLALQNAVGYAKQRRAFGKSIAEFGLIREKLGEMTARIFAGESILYRTVGLIDSMLAASREGSDGARRAIEEYAIECSINKVYVSEILDYVTDECVQIYGGYGYHQDYPAERAYRDARINRIFEGTNEINRLVTVNMLLKRGATGQLALMRAAMRVMQEPGSSPQHESAASGPLASERSLVEGAKKATLLVAALAYQKYSTTIADQQEVLAAIADMVMEVFAMESVVLRAQKIASRSQGQNASASNALKLARLVVYTRMETVEQRARMVLAAVGSGEKTLSQQTQLTGLIRRELIDTIELRRDVAARVIEQSKYSV